jgi:Rrf2 family nitric oxide-sensitive transcriptional repressor
MNQLIGRCGLSLLGLALACLLDYGALYATHPPHRLCPALVDQPRQDAGGRRSIAEIAEEQAISRTHLMKIANHLAHAGFIEATRGRGGGLCLAHDPAAINLGAVVAEMEPGCTMIDCTGCRLLRKCNLPGVLADARRAFRAVVQEFAG